MKRLFHKLGSKMPSTEEELQKHAIRHLDLSIMIDLAIEVWRLQSRLKRMSVLTGREDDPALSFSVDKLRDIFFQVGIEIRDLTGQTYNEGMTLDVLTCDYPADEKPEQRIIQETISPAIFLDGKLFKMSQVILGKAGADADGQTNN
jgi:hypothetical protein